MTDDDDFFDSDDGETTWECKASEAVESAVEYVSLDEVRGMVYLSSGEDHKLNRVTEEFKDLESVITRLTEIAESEWISYVPFDGGVPLFAPHVDGIVEDKIVELGIEDFFERLRTPEDSEELISSSQLVQIGKGLAVESDTKDINDELIRYLAKHPEVLREINPGKFEELVAALFRAKGYQVELTPRTRDGGLDIRVFMKSDIGTILTLVECKRYAAHKKVGVGIVRGLYGVVSSQKATIGLVATTSYFTKDAKSFQAENRYRLELSDFDTVRSWLCSYKSKN